MKISVIVPVYNVESYLKKCLDSILEQSYTNLEVILINDGSTDLSGQICEEYSRKDKRIKLFHQTNQGLSAARNEGIKQSTGEILSFIDSDDYVNKDFYKLMILTMEKYDADIVQCGFEKVDENSRKINKTVDFSELSEDEIYEGENTLDKLYSRNYVETVIMCNKLYKTHLFYNIKFPVGKLHEDEFTTFRLLDRAKKMVIIDAKLYYYYQRADSITHKKFNVKRLDVIQAYKEQVLYFRSKNMRVFEEKSLIKLEFKIRSYMKKYKYLDSNQKKEILNMLKHDYKVHFEDFKKVYKNDKIRLIAIYFIRYSPQNITNKFLFIIEKCKGIQVSKC